MLAVLELCVSTNGFSAELVIRDRNISVSSKYSNP
jgi:hypothetical protein